MNSRRETHLRKAELRAKFLRGMYDYYPFDSADRINDFVQYLVDDYTVELLETMDPDEFESRCQLYKAYNQWLSNARESKEVCDRYLRRHLHASSEALAVFWSWRRRQDKTAAPLKYKRPYRTLDTGSLDTDYVRMNMLLSESRDMVRLHLEEKHNARTVEAFMRYWEHTRGKTVWQRYIGSVALDYDVDEYLVPELHKFAFTTRLPLFRK